MIAKSEIIRLLHEIADEARPKVRRAILEAIAAAKDDMSLVKLARGLRTHDLESLWQEMQWDRISKTKLLPVLREVLRDVMEKAGQITAERIIKSEVAFDVTSPHMVDWIRRETADLITIIGRETQLAIREVILQGYQQGLNIGQMAQMIKTTGGFGLNKNQAAALRNYRDRLVKQAVAPDQIEKLAVRYYNKLLKDRAEMIAHWETMKAANEGHRDEMRQAVANGELDPARWEVRWTYIKDGNACDKCESMDDERREIMGVYSGGDYAGTDGPPAHVRCRCGETLRLKKKLKLAEMAEAA